MWPFCRSVSCVLILVDCIRRPSQEGVCGCLCMYVLVIFGVQILYKFVSYCFIIHLLF